jgi:hypothetical protein
VAKDTKRTSETRTKNKKGWEIQILGCRALWRPLTELFLVRLSSPFGEEERIKKMHVQQQSSTTDKDDEAEKGKKKRKRKTQHTVTTTSVTRAGASLVAAALSVLELCGRGVARSGG